MGDKPVARRSDPQTSWDAARSVDKVRESQAQVLYLLKRYGPMTDVQIAATFREVYGKGQSPSGLRTRRAELVDKGLVSDSGERWRLDTGRWAIVWHLVEGHGSEPAAATLF